MDAVAQYCAGTMFHYNAGELLRAAEAYTQLIADGGTMCWAVAGAMSTARLGVVMAEMIREGKIGAISCTGANLEESVYSLIGYQQYKPLTDEGDEPHYRDLTPEDEERLADQGMVRVTDQAIPDEEVTKPVTETLLRLWQRAEHKGESHFPHEYFYEALKAGTWAHLYQDDPANCWLYAAMERDLPIVVGGWEDSTEGNAYAAACLRGEVDKTANVVKDGIDYLMAWAAWYAETAPTQPIGFFQIGGGIAGDFPICVVPLLKLELDRDDVPYWAYFCQITDATTSYGGYSGALPNEKITWRKLDKKTPSFVIESDATICVPLIAAIVLAGGVPE